MAHDVFISYSSKDKAAADAACAVLEQNGIRCWIAPRDIRPGDDWGETIIDAITASRAFLLIFSNHANASNQVKREVERAVNRGLPIVPMRIEEVMPARSLEYFLSTPHWLDAFTPPLAAHLQYLTRIIGQILNGEAPGGPGPVPLRRYRRRAVIAMGGAGVLGLIGALVYALVPWSSDKPAPAEPGTPAPSKPDEAPPPAPPPSFVGHWVLEKVTVAEAAWRVLGTSTFGSLGDAFARNGVTAGRATATFEVNALSQFAIDLRVDDHGTVRREGKAAIFTSALDEQAIRGELALSSPENSAHVVEGLGGAIGDHVLFVGTGAPFLPVSYVGRPDPAARGPLAAMAGQWTNTASPQMAGTIKRELELSGEGGYRYAAAMAERGIWQASNGTWRRDRDNGTWSQGVYAFDGPNRVTIASGSETMILRRDGTGLP